MSAACTMPKCTFLCICECVHVVKLLLLSGDVESNPGPNNSSSLPDELAEVVKAINAHVDARHKELKTVLDELKSSQAILEQTVSDINSRLVAVEARVNSFDKMPPSNLQQTISDTVRGANAELRSRLDDFEDRSRRENLLFFGIPDAAAETWSQSEDKVREIMSTLGLQLPTDAISRAHRLGSYANKKCRPVIVKLSNFKVKESIMANKAKLKGIGVSLSEDFCKETRNTRKKLYEYGKSTGQQFAVRYNKLFINKKCFVYCSQTDSVCELTREFTSSLSPSSTNIPSSVLPSS